MQGLLHQTVSANIFSNTLIQMRTVLIDICAQLYLDFVKI